MTRIIHSAVLVAALAFGLVPRPACAAPDPVAAALSNALRYNLTVWYPTVDLANPKGQVRTDASVAYAVAVALTTGGYDEAAVGVPADVARADAVSLVDSVSAAHGSIWGHDWETGYFTYLAATAGWLLGHPIPDVLADEADYRLRARVRYYADRLGHIITPGDSGAEEDAWDHLLFDLAARTLPTAPHAAAWRARARLLQTAALTRPVDLPARPRLAGWNVRNDGTLANHSTPISPHYMAVAVALDQQPRSSSDTRAVYAALARYYRPDGTVGGHPDDWGVVVTPYIEADAVAGNDHWLDVHVGRLAALQARFVDGRTYADGENHYPAREQVVVVDLATVWMLRRAPR